MSIRTNLRQFSVDKFLWNAESRMFSAELSDLGRDTPFHLIYHDACDVGFVVRNDKTGQHVVFCVERQERDSDGDLVAYHLCPSPESIRKYPKLQNVKMILFND